MATEDPITPTNLFINFVISVSMFIAIVYIIYVVCVELYKVIREYQKQSGQDASNLGANKRNTNPLLDPAQDNVSSAANGANGSKLSDQYTEITKAIMNSFNQYSTYNEQMKQYYANIRKQEGTPPLMDTTVLNPRHDNW
jgi:hypothetical protein